jgi:hypothetical protein
MTDESATLGSRRPSGIPASRRGLRAGAPRRLPRAQRRAAVEQTAQLLTELGHEVVERNPRYGQLLPEIMPSTSTASHSMP